jgi:hypothetical protein|tara:strand:+ start:5536 stop:5736 length:201 start_codon:yes stop_codon:yes gene_type:complete
MKFIKLCYFIIIISILYFLLLDKINIGVFKNKNNNLKNENNNLKNKNVSFADEYNIPIKTLIKFNK